MRKTRFTLTELAACAEREVRQRKRVYARLVPVKMTPAQAERETAMMEDIARWIAAEAEENPRDAGKLL